MGGSPHRKQHSQDFKPKPSSHEATVQTTEPQHKLKLFVFFFKNFKLKLTQTTWTETMREDKKTIANVFNLHNSQPLSLKLNTWLDGWVVEALELKISFPLWAQWKWCDTNALLKRGICVFRCPSSWGISKPFVPNIGRTWLPKSMWNETTKTHLVFGFWGTVFEKCHNTLTENSLMTKWLRCWCCSQCCFVQHWPVLWLWFLWSPLSILTQSCCYFLSNKIPCL